MEMTLKQQQAQAASSFGTERASIARSQQATYSEMMAKAKELYASGDTDSAKHLAAIALKRKNEAERQSPGETPGAPLIQQTNLTGEIKTESGAAKLAAMLDKIAERNGTPSGNSE